MAQTPYTQTLSISMLSPSPPEDDPTLPTHTPLHNPPALHHRPLLQRWSPLALTPSFLQPILLESMLPSPIPALSRTLFKKLMEIPKSAEGLPCQQPGET